MRFTLIPSTNTKPVSYTHLKTVMTTEPKFVPSDAVMVTFSNNVRAKLRLIDLSLIHI